MPNPIGPVLPADETFAHQIAETFASVATSDPAWTEKVCAMAMARDGSLQLGFGLGKYTNRNVMDGYAVLSRGTEQLTVRASRELAAAPGATFAGPIRLARWSLQNDHVHLIVEADGVRHSGGDVRVRPAACARLASQSSPRPNQPPVRLRSAPVTDSFTAATFPALPPLASARPRPRAS